MTRPRKPAPTAPLEGTPSTPQPEGAFVAAGSLESLVEARREGVPFAVFEPAIEDAAPAGSIAINLFR